jgi:hypothetical protein
VKSLKILFNCYEQHIFAMKTKANALYNHIT